MELDDNGDEIIEILDSLNNDEVANDIENIEISEEDENDDVDLENDDLHLDNVWGIFSRHEGSVFTVALNHLATLAVSGGEDDKAYVWNIAEGDSIIDCDGHKDSVICAAFSHDDCFVATADMSGLIKVWKIQSKKEVWSFETSEIEWLKWHHQANVLFAGTICGNTWVWKIPSGECKTLQSFGQKTTSALLLPDGSTIAIGYFDGTIKVWDVKESSVLHTIIANEKSQVLCLDYLNNLILSGFENGLAKLINNISGKIVGAFNCCIPDSDGNSVESVGFCKSQNLAATAILGGTIFIWDISSLICRYQLKQEAQIVKLLWSPSREPLLYIADLSGHVRLWDARDGQNKKEWHIHRKGILDFDFASNGSFFVSGSEDGTVAVVRLSE